MIKFSHSEPRPQGSGSSGGANRSPSPTVSQLEALEHFASKPTAQVTWSKEVGRIDTDQAHAVIIALVVVDASQTPRQMRGIRIDLTSADAKDQVYTSEDLLERLIKALDAISNGLPGFYPRARVSNACFGSGIFWLQGGHALSASQCVFGDWSGLSVSSGRHGFRFTGLNPAPFAAAIARARDELKQR